MARKKQWQGKFYDPNLILARGAPVSMVLSGRGPGKSFSFKRLCIASALKNGSEWIYLRRSGEEVGAAAKTLFDDIQDPGNGHPPSFPEHQFKIEGGGMFYADARPGFDLDTGEELKPDWIRFGALMNLSTYQKFKSTTYPAVTQMLYDEFIPEGGYSRELKDEPRAFDSIRQTVFRDRRHRIFMLGNLGTLGSSYFYKWKLNPEGAEWQFQKRFGVIMHRATPSAEYIERMLASDAMRGQEDTGYTLGTRFEDSNDVQIMRKPKGTSPSMAIETPVARFVLHRVPDESGTYWVGTKEVRANIELTTVAINASPEKRLMLRDDKLLRRIRSYFGSGMIYFESNYVKRMFINELI